MLQKEKEAKNEKKLLTFALHGSGKKKGSDDEDGDNSDEDNDSEEDSEEDSEDEDSEEEDESESSGGTSDDENNKKKSTSSWLPKLSSPSRNNNNKKEAPGTPHRDTGNPWSNDNGPGQGRNLPPSVTNTRATNLLTKKPSLETLVEVRRKKKPKKSKKDSKKKKDKKKDDKSKDNKKGPESSEDESISPQSKNTMRAMSPLKSLFSRATAANKAETTPSINTTNEVKPSGSIGINPTDSNAAGDDAPARPTGFRAVRNTLNFANKLRTMVQVSNDANAGATPVKPVKLMCTCDDVMIKIPGCHGNSVFKFDIFDGERKIAQCFFYLGKEGELMYWGGEYSHAMQIIQQRRAVLHSGVVTSAGASPGLGGGPVLGAARASLGRAAGGAPTAQRRQSNAPDSPMIDFRVIAGAPLRSR